MSALVHLKYGYDQASNRTYRRDEVARTNNAKFDELYGYDGLHRLENLDRGELNGTNMALVGFPSLTQDWTLDPTGNWNAFGQGIVDVLEQTRTHNKVNEITAISETVGLPWADPAQDANGNLTTLPQSKQLDDGYTATYDAWNRLVKLTNDADGDKTVAEYQYDGLNRRTVKQTFDGSGSLDATRHAYFSDRWQVLEERVDAATTADRQYLWGERYVDDLVLRDKGSERLYALSDALFNVVALTDNTGSVKERLAYQPYGQSEELNPNFTDYSGTDYGWEYRFTGRELDLESGLQLNRNRYLHLQLGRWITRDPIGYEGSPWNLYEYVNGQPTVLTDSSGEFGCTSIVVPTPPAIVEKCKESCSKKGFGFGSTTTTRTDCIFCGVAFGWSTTVCLCNTNCKPCPKPPGPVTDTGRDHGGCKAKTGSNTHWHYYEYNQDPKTCRCYGPKRRFGGCGPAPQ